MDMENIDKEQNARKNTSVLGKLEKKILVIIQQSTSAKASSEYKSISLGTLSLVLQFIEKLKEEEVENSRLDWKDGYLECCLDVAEFFGNKRDESLPTGSEMEEIEEQSFDYINRKNN